MISAYDIHGSMDIMEVAMQVSKWGNSLGVRLPKALVDELGLKPGDELNLCLKATSSTATRRTSGECVLRQ
jgi:antitoxin component of MazEF toxin-antitoxin module